MSSLLKISAMAALSCVLLAGSAARADEGRRSVGAALAARSTAPSAAPDRRDRGRPEVRALAADVRGNRREDAPSAVREAPARRESRAEGPQPAGGREAGAHQVGRSEPRRARQPGSGQERMRAR